RTTAKGRGFASLLLGEYKGKDLHYRGRVGTGFDGRTLTDIARRLAALERRTSPFVDAPRSLKRDTHWVEPRLVAEVAYTERTSDGYLRQPRFLGLRADKPAHEVTTETRVVDPPPASRKARKVASAKSSSAGARSDAPLGVKLTHPEKVFYPKQD